MILVSKFFLRYQSHFNYHVLKLGSVKPQDGTPVLEHDEYLVMAIEQSVFETRKHTKLGWGTGLPIHGF